MPINAYRAQDFSRRLYPIEQLTRLTEKFQIFMKMMTLLGGPVAKRVLDISGALLGLAFCLPIFIITAIAIWLEDPGPVFYVRNRVGKHRRIFRFIKFRSMIVNADKLKKNLFHQNDSSDGVIFKMKNDPRVTRVGRIIRKFSIDELPQLYNVLKGDMSLVGPRPPVPSEVEQYNIRQRKRLDITPGLTCLWQINGRSDIPFSAQVDLDLEYIRTRSFLGDCFIILKTFPAVLSGRGAY